ncbi:fungal chitosanase of glycosyl hydrolase group 75-domain-containing protein [Biscogniauxia mediterranea]|nr:fungal chitosanase of glycosyl hydrolase group 75-domain-containing protein [Biscogniauxia mediterranea]
MLLLNIALALSLVPGLCFSRDIPENIDRLYRRITNLAQCTANEQVGYYTSPDSNEDTFGYCADFYQSYGIMYIQGMQRHLADMDVTCKGLHGGPADDGRCNSPSPPGSTSFSQKVASYKKSIPDLSPYIHPYVVFGNSGTTRPFEPRQYGIEPLSVMAVVCNGKLIYGLWGDERHDSGARALVGEASLALATACYGDAMSAGHGHPGTDVLYIGFNGTEAVPGRDGAKWDAKSYGEFEASIEGLGDKLIERITPPE